MVVLRCTRKLLARVGPPSEDPPPSTTALGDWYAQPVSVGRMRFVLLISEHSRLPVLMPGRDVKNLGRNFPNALAHVLLDLGIPPASIKREMEATREFVIAKTNNRSLLGTLGDFSNMLWHHLNGRPDPNMDVDLVDVSIWLAHTPVQPLRPSHFPDKVTRQLLQ